MNLYKTIDESKIGKIVGKTPELGELYKTLSPELNQALSYQKQLYEDAQAAAKENWNRTHAWGWDVEQVWNGKSFIKDEYSFEYIQAACEAIGLPKEWWDKLEAELKNI